MEADGMMRLDKFLAKMGAGSRQEVKSYIRKGMVSVNGETVSRPETKIDEEKDEIFLQGKSLQASYRQRKTKKRLRWWILSERRSERICFL